MPGYHIDIEKKTLENKYFREVLFTAGHCQLVVMSIAPGDDIGMEVHHDVDQFFRVEAGQGKAVMDGQEVALADGSALVIPAGTEHNLINTSKTEPLQLYTLYAPANHPQGTIHKDKEEAEVYERQQHGH